MNDRDSLCLRCGLCCSGAFFEHLTIHPHELERVTRRLLVVGDKLSLPCVAHTDDMKCRIYAERPATCAAYRCEVLQAVEAARMPFDDAASLVHQLKKGFRSLRPRIPGNGNLRQDIARFVVESPEWRRAHADLLLDIASFLKLVDRFVGENRP